METDFVAMKQYNSDTSPHSLGKLIEWKPFVLMTVEYASYLSPLAGETN